MPIEYLKLNSFKPADIVCLVSRDRTDLFVIHMALVVCWQKDLLILESAKSLKTTATTLLPIWLEKKKNEFLGVLIFRAKTRWRKRTTAVSPLSIARIRSGD
jgi:hypothetical protein